jgi:ribosomal protein L4
METKKSKLYSSSRWKQLRRLAMGKAVTCVYCFRAKPYAVDHLDGDPANNSSENLFGVCSPCHSRKTMLVDAILRLYMVRSAKDALLYYARKIKQDVTLESRLLTNLADFEPLAVNVYEFFKANSLYRDEAASEEINARIPIWIFRYTLAVIECNRDSYNRIQNLRRRRG